MKSKFISIFIFVITIFHISCSIAIFSEKVKTVDQRISALKSIKIPNTKIISAVPVGPEKGPAEYASVVARIHPAINFEVRMPLSEWNGKFHMAGCGGFCGRPDRIVDSNKNFNAIKYAVKDNYAVAYTDTGHRGTNIDDAKWAYHNRQAEIDWGRRSVHEVTMAAKKIIKAFYGKGPSYSYFVGCSTGGRLAVMEALRYPKDFNGIISGAPALNYTDLVGTFFSWIVQANRDDKGKIILNHTKLDLIESAVLEACKKTPGLVNDNLISNPARCNFDPQSLLCNEKNFRECLNVSQVEVLKKFYNGPKNSKGEPLYTGGLPMGSEPFWSFWVTGNGEGKSGFIEKLNIDFLKYMAFETDPDSRWDPYAFNFDTDPAKLSYMSQIYNATGTDLSEFKNNGGKLIMYHGWADAVVPPSYTIDYYAKVVEKMGGFQKVRDFYRLFMVPGMDHCGIFSEAYDKVDFFSALENWVEKGQAPDQIIAGQKVNEARTRPLCAYPSIAAYTQPEKDNDAAYFVCK
ncbi:MAG: tannase/feruloyl esterase family alpha/beta hydrolase [Desulfobacteraceae bacterium]|nr:tannase/feruloyl esterase family alpha/beta hydrolase [Desulfobacteraceae bacterium]